MSSTTSGRVRTRFSLQPSRAAPPKSPAVRLRCCSIVPIAPSSTSIRSESSCRRALADSFKLRISGELNSSLPDFLLNGGHQQRRSHLGTPLFYAALLPESNALQPT